MTTGVSPSSLGGDLKHQYSILVFIAFKIVQTQHALACTTRVGPNIARFVVVVVVESALLVCAVMIAGVISFAVKSPIQMILEDLVSHSLAH
jgi:hypothetical protein